MTRGQPNPYTVTTARYLCVAYLLCSSSAWWGWVGHAHDTYPSLVWIWAGEAFTLTLITGWLVHVHSRLATTGKPQGRRVGGPGQPPHERWMSPIAPSGGPLEPRLIAPDGTRIDLILLPRHHSTGDGWHVWLAFGPAGREVPMGCEIVFEHLPYKHVVVIQSEENLDGRQVFMPIPQAMHTPN